MRNYVIRLMVVAVGTSIMVGQAAKAEVAIPECSSLVEWANISMEVDKNFSGRSFQPKPFSGKFLLWGLRDEQLKPYFGETLDQWKAEDFTALKAKFQECRNTNRADLKEAFQESRETGDRSRHNELRNQHRVFDQYVNRKLSAARRDSYGNTFEGILAHQQDVYTKHYETLARFKTINAEIGEMGPSIQNIERIDYILEHENFEYLDPNLLSEVKAQLPEIKVSLMDKLLDKKLEEFNSLEKTYTNIAVMKKSYDEFKSANYRRKSSKWRAFDDGFKLAYNAHVTASLPSYQEHIKSLPTERDSVRAIDNELSKMFPRRDRDKPRDYIMFFAAANDQKERLKARIKKKECEETKATLGLDEDAAEMIVLGPKGPIPLDKFMCRINPKHFKVMKWEEPGFFGSEYTFSFYDPFGGEAQIVFEEQELLDGREALVGIEMTANGKEKELTQAEWRDIAKWLNKIDEEFHTLWGG
ncbi:hypothetical protein [Kordiimonas laminariae]|uniref:hypothetical protein n=1 Tax=Kordiimonas laminariae TaxID=2917717 RepID=UPI001FF6D09B|nr:hypothetical protein [Kordiimonas laminariae]MCK0070242.1 hypothetical protein [Kordiimonas laminariae]